MDTRPPPSGHRVLSHESPQVQHSLGPGQFTWHSQSLASSSGPTSRSLSLVLPGHWHATQPGARVCLAPGFQGLCAHRVPTWTRREGLEGPPACVQVTVMRRGGRTGRASRLLHWPGSGVSPSPEQHGRLGFTVFRVKSGSSQARKVPRAAPFPSS